MIEILNYVLRKKYWVGGGVVYNFVPFVAPEVFNDPRKYADFRFDRKPIRKI